MTLEELAAKTMLDCGHCQPPDSPNSTWGACEKCVLAALREAYKAGQADEAWEIGRDQE